MTVREQLAEAYSRKNWDHCICNGQRWVAVTDPRLRGQAVPCFCVLQERDAKAPLKLYRASGITEGYDRYTFATFDPKLSVALPKLTEKETAKLMQGVVDTCKMFVEMAANNKARWLIMCGPVGSGKTHLAGAIANALLERHVPVIIANTVALLGAIQAGFKDNSHRERVEAIRAVQVLVLDDFGAETPTPWARERLYEIIEARSVGHMATVFTSNILPTELTDMRIKSRLLQGAHTEEGFVTLLPFRCGDYRRFGKKPLQAEEMEI